MPTLHCGVISMLLPSDFHDIKTRYVRTRKMAFLSIARSAQTIKDSIRKISSLFNRYKFLKKRKKIKIALPNTKATHTMVFCYENCSDILWEKSVLVIEKNFWNSRLKAKILRSLEQFVQTVKGKNHFW